MLTFYGNKILNISDSHHELFLQIIDDLSESETKLQKMKAAVSTLHFIKFGNRLPAVVKGFIKSKKMNQVLNLRIILEKPPLNVHFGLQKGSGNVYQTIQVQKSTAADLQFDVAVNIKNAAKQLGEPNFVGPFVQGAAPDKFVYIDIGTYTGQQDSLWGRRLKIPLKGITWDMIVKVQADPTFIIETQVPGTGKDGGPNCATVKPFAGWKLSNI